MGDVGTICAIGLAGAEAAAARATPTAAAEEAGATAEASAGGGCFPAGTPVATAEGDRPIETIQPGDLVLTADPDTGEQSYQRETRTSIRASDELFQIELADGRSVEATGEHPFWVESKGFVLARYLARSDLLRDEDGHRVPVVRITSRAGRFTVCNFEVQPTHTYYAAGWWVHNQCPKALGPPGDAGNLGRSRMDRFNSLTQTGFETESGVYSIHDHFLSRVKQSGRRKIDPESLIRALNSPSAPGKPGSRVFTDPVTGNRFFVNDNNLIVSAYPPGFK